ncbi:multidrug DMT transporter permease [Sporosarcina cyprini]|uniref:multidrug DMT transporter permease n=1 Tax=Sporosarcina cyprini TaxID=2910523 RepID=UPI001EDDE1FF|nr:multidrug DMT transporter permease [Sporosarcina cyprini]MCG3088859.1 multidrug DMT transporter permease [Sporosarcina cyprini]
MKTKWLLSSSAVMMGLIGLAGTFMSEEISEILGGSSPISLILLQIIGGLYLGFAMLNWFKRSARIGGIYNKPVVLGNLIHFVVVLFALIRQLAEQFDFMFFILSLVYLGFAIWFALVMRSNPISN